MKKMNRFFILFCLIFWGFSAWAETSFEQWKADFYKTAKAQNISTATLDKCLSNAKYLPKVIELDRKQPEFTSSFGQYMQRAVSNQRIVKARQMLKKHKTQLQKVESKYGVPAQYLLAFWAVETNFGAVKGNTDICNALSTLSFDERRREFFSEQLITLFKILEKENVDVPRASWAGAFGHFQFMPTTFYQYAVDGNDDGVRDIVSDFDDALASAANYLSKMGWQRGQVWGRQVVLPENSDLYLKAGEKHTLKDWTLWGIHRTDGQAYQADELDMDARLLLPEGINGPAFLTYKNFDVMKRWNNSNFYALAVGVLADNVSWRATVDVDKLEVLPSLSRSDIIFVQKFLKDKNLYQGKLDGRMGKGSVEGLKLYQKSQKLPADGFLSKELLEKIKK